MTAMIAVLAHSRCLGLGRQPWLCAHNIPARPRQARMFPVYRRIDAMTTLVSEWPSAGRMKDSGSLTGTVSAFGAVAPTIIPSSRPAPDRLRATMGSDSGLQASLRITRLMTHSTGPLRTTRSDAGGKSTVPGRPGGPAGWVDTRVTWSYLRWRTCAATTGAHLAPPHRRLSAALVAALQTPDPRLSPA